MKRYTFLLLALFALPFLSYGQSIDRSLVATTGGSFSNATFSADYSVGEAVIMTFTTPTLILTQGFQQPPSFPDAIGEQETGPEVTLYPNPTSGSLSILIGDDQNGPVLVEVFDILGQVVHSVILNTDGQVPLQYDMNLHSLATGTYHLRVISGSRSRVLPFVKVSK